MNIILTGLRGSGKSTVGKILAKELDKQFIDIDDVIESDIGESISQLVEKEGWEAFREAEHEAVKQVIKERDMVIACGGGTVCYSDNADLLKKSGKIILLKISPDIAAKRIGESTNRPPLTGSNNEMEKVWNERKRIYLSTADIIIESKDKSPDRIAEEIITLI